MFNKIKNSLVSTSIALKGNKAFKAVYTFLFSVFMVSNLILTAPLSAFATADENITSASTQQVQSRVFGNVHEVAKVIGVICIAIAIVMIAVNMLINHNRPDARSQGMDAMLTVIIASLIIGGLALFFGFFWGNAGGIG